MKRFLNPPDIHPPVAGYTHQIEVSDAERLLFFSGQIGMRPDGSLPEAPIEQLDMAFENLIRNLHAAGMEVDDLVKLTFYLVGDMDPVKRKDIINARLQGHKPCMTLMFVAGLASPTIKVELDAWASKEG
jgi:2-iminobutanoate/2-iminopropanoate deaminase